MNIIRATSIEEVLDCIPIEIEIRKKEDEYIKLKDMLAFLESQISQPYLGFYIAYEEEKIIGFLVLFYVPLRGFEQIQIMRVWYDHHYKEVIKEFENIIRQWKRETKAPRVTVEMEARRKGKSNMGRIKAFKKKWGFSLRTIVLERRK